MQLRSAALSALLLLAASPAARAQEPLVIPRLTGPVQLDGLSDEPAWEGIEPLPMTMTRPTFQGTPTERTEVRIAHDDDYLYVAGRLYDSDPSGIRATSLKRDDMDLSNDYFGIILDTFRDNENALTFWTTPAGIRTDFSVFGDAQGAFPANVSWNAPWDVEVARSGEGWFAEFRIPFSTLRFQDRDGEVRMGLITWRSVARKNEFVIFPAISQKWGFWGMFKPSQAREVVLQGVYGRKPLYVTPYALGGYGRSARLDDAETAYRQVGEPEREVGVDLKYGLTSNVTLDLTANTDFAQVEADDQQVNLTRFSLFFPEKRQFFQERSSVFDFRTDGVDRLFYSRRIGLSSAGAPLRIYGGARMVGRVGKWDVGLLDMQTAAENGTGSENMGVFRVRRQVLNLHSYAGAIVTSRIGPDGRYNAAYGADGVFRLSGQDYLALNWAQTFEDSVPGAGDATLASASLERRTVDGLGYSLGLTRAGAGYNPGLGFIRRTDYTRAAGSLAYGWRYGDGSRLARQGLAGEGAVFLRNADRSTESAWAASVWSMESRAGALMELRGGMNYEDLREGFRISSGAEIPAGSYRFYDLSAAYDMPASSLLRAGVRAEAGSFYDGWRVSAGVTPSWTFSSRLELGGSYGYTYVALPDRGQEFRAHVGRLRLQAMLNTRLSAASFVQYNSASRSVAVNARLRYNPREGDDLYLVYNEGLNTELDRFAPARPRSASRTLLLKYSRTFSPSLFSR